MKRVMLCSLLLLLAFPLKVYARVPVEDNVKSVKSTSSETYTDEEITSIADVVYTESNNQSEMGKRLVIDVILNRVDNETFPNTVQEVLSQKGQFSKYSYGQPLDDIIVLVKEEIDERTNEDVLFFKKNGYHSFGEPILKEGAHYFSGLEE